MYPELSESQRFPILTSPGRALLQRMRQHPHAPVWNWPNGEQLDEVGLAKVERFARELNSQTKLHEPTRPNWLAEFTERCVQEVPFYRGRVSAQTPFDEIPTCRRADLAPRVWEFVPDTEPLDELIVFSSSGTTGYPTRTPHSPFSAACGVPLLEYGLRALMGIELLRGPEHVAITNVAAYRGAFTTAIVVAWLQEAGCVRVNLDRSAWRAEDDRVRFINTWKAPIWLGDPIAFAALQDIELDHAPKAIISSIMHLPGGFAEELHRRYGCPVLDFYAMTEAGLIAVGDRHGHRILPHDLYVEILDEQDQPCPEGVCGEITLTGGRNPYLPLLRYRTGDQAALKIVDGLRYLIGFAGRQPVEYPTSTGKIVHSMELTQLMRRFPVVRYHLYPLADSRYKLVYQGHVDTAELRKELQGLFGSDVHLSCDFASDPGTPDG